MSSAKKLSNPFSTGGGGIHFEAHVQASFVTLMLTGGHAPGFPHSLIVEIKLQGKIDGFDTDDLVVIVENPNSKERRRLLCQVKHFIAVTRSNTEFRKVIQAAWNDFNNPKVLTRGKDIIALITGPLSAIDTHNLPWLLDQARHTNDVDDFFRRVHQAKFGPSGRAKKLGAIQHHLKAANGGNEVTRDELYTFLKQFRLLSYDLGNDFSVVLSLLHSHISQFEQQLPHWAWGRICQFVQECNQNAGIITPGNLPEDLLEAFKQKPPVEMPEELKTPQEESVTDWTRHTDAKYLALAALIGAWNERSQSDLGAVTQLLGISYDEWLNKAQEILHLPGSPLTLKNGIWKVVNRTELLCLLGSRILDQNLDALKSLAVSTLKEPDPSLELSIEERLSANIQGKGLECSHTLRKGVAEGLAIMSTMPDAFSYCSQGEVESTCSSAIREILIDADWILWGSLNRLLPTLAEAAPGEFLDAVENALRLTPCPFVEIFTQEGDGIAGDNYLTGLLWALEGLAWDERYLVRVCVVLSELTSHDPGGRWANRPFNSLLTILLPWRPQTFASVEKRNVAVQTLLNEWPEIAWKLIIQLLPGQQQISSGSYKPVWRMTIPDEWKKGVTNKEYWQQTAYYAELAVATAGHDIGRLTSLIDQFNNLPRLAFDQLIEVLTSDSVTTLPEDKRQVIWDHLTKLAVRHRRFSEAKWTMEEKLIVEVEQVAEMIAPTNPFNLYQHLFTRNEFDLYERNDDWEEQRNELHARRDKAILEIFGKSGIDGVIQFSESVNSPDQVGLALGVVTDDNIERTLLPKFLNAPDNNHKELASGFVWRRHDLLGWEWCDNIEKSDWTPTQIGQFVAYLPFNKKTWSRASRWLKKHEAEYWKRTNSIPYPNDLKELSVAIEKLIEHGRPHAAIRCLNSMRDTMQTVNTDQCVRALMAALSSDEPAYTMDDYLIVELVKYLQADSSVDQDHLFRIEWAYLSLLDSHGIAPHILESRLASDPEFYCEIIRLIYRSEKEDLAPKESTKESSALAANAWRLLHEWKTPPGTQQDDSFSEERFRSWLQRVKNLCMESGHLEVALISIGQVLFHAKVDPDGLWINRAIAAALNASGDDGLRRGYVTGAYNSRGVHSVDPTGNPDRELAENFRSKAEAIENAGFQRFAVALQDLADDYDRQAERIIAEHASEGE